MIYKLTPLAPRARQERSPTDSSLMLKTVVVKEKNIKMHHHRRTQHKPEARHDFPTILYTIMENDMDEHHAAPPMKTTVKKEKREPIRKSHRRTCATDWNELSGTCHGNISNRKKQQQHRRSLAMTKDEFTEITMVCDELHGPWAPPRVRRAVVWDAPRTCF